MKWLLALALCSLPAWGQIGTVTPYSTFLNNNSSENISLVATAASIGDLLWEVVEWEPNDTGCTGTTSAFEGTDTPVQVGTAMSEGLFTCTAVFYFANISANSPTIGATVGASRPRGISVLDIPGAAKTSPLVSSGSAQSTTSNGTATVSGLTGSAIGYIVVGGAGQIFGASTWIAGSPGMTIPAGATASTGGSTLTVTSEYAVLAATTTTATIKWSGTAAVNFFAAIFAAAPSSSCSERLTLLGAGC